MASWKSSIWQSISVSSGGSAKPARTGTNGFPDMRDPKLSLSHSAILDSGSLPRVSWFKLHARLLRLVPGWMSISLGVSAVLSRDFSSLTENSTHDPRVSSCANFCDQLRRWTYTGRFTQHCPQCCCEEISKVQQVLCHRSAAGRSQPQVRNSFKSTKENIRWSYSLDPSLDVESESSALLSSAASSGITTLLRYATCSH